MKQSVKKITAFYIFFVFVGINSVNLVSDLAVLEINLNQLSNLLSKPGVQGDRVPRTTPKVSPVKEKKEYFGKVFTDVPNHAYEVGREDSIDKIGFEIVAMGRVRFGPDEPRGEVKHKQFLNALYGLKIAGEELKDKLLKVPAVTQAKLNSNLKTNWEEWVRKHIEWLSEADQQKAKLAFSRWLKF